MPGPDDPALDAKIRLREVQNDIKNRFTYAPPREDQVARYATIRADARDLALKLVELCPESRELSLALTHLDEVVMFANASIARHES